MKSSSCSIKLLEKAYIGIRVRMTSDKSTLPFDNKPMKDVTIIDYNIQGFKLTHPSLPKTVWVDFKQLPLTNLTIINGVIKDEITFVENIIVHQMELIKTDMLDYIELLDIKEKEKQKTFITLSDVKPGDLVMSSLCENGEPMIYLGTWYTKNINIERRYGYNNEAKKYHLSKLSPQRAFFLIKSSNGDLSFNETEQIKNITNFNGYYYKNKSEYEYRDNLTEFNMAKKKYFELIEECKQLKTTRYKIVNYAVTSKPILNLVDKNQNFKEFSNLSYNKDLIFYNVNVGGWSELNIVNNKRKHLYENREYNYIISNSVYTNNDVKYLSKTKDNINELSKIFIEEMYGIKLEKELK